MTEYDYSPAAYEKYLATQARIARWVDDTQRTKLVGPDVPPTPLDIDGAVPLPHHKDRKSRSSRPTPASSPAPEKRSSSRKRSKSVSAPREEEFVPTPWLPEPGRPIYRPWANEVAQVPRPPTPPKPKSPTPPAQRVSRHKQRSPTRAPRNPNWPPDFKPSKNLPEPGCPIYGYVPSSSDSDDEAPAVEPPRPPHSAARKRSMSFSAVPTRPLHYSPPTAPQYHSHNNSPHYGSASRDHSSYYSSHNSSPVNPYPSSALYAPQAVPVPHHTHAPAPVYPQKSFSYPLPHQQYPNYDAVRQRRPSHIPATATHTPHYSVDGTAPFAYNAPGHHHQRNRPVEQIYQQHQQPPPRPSSVPHPGTRPYKFPNGKTLHFVPPTMADIQNHPDRYQVPLDYYVPPTGKRPHLLKRIFTGFGKSHGDSSTKSSGVQSAQSSPTRKTIRRRTSSIG